MKVLFVTRKFPPSVGGMELFAFELSQALARKTDIKLVKWGGRGRMRALLIALPYLFIRSLWQMLKGGIDIIHAHDGVLAPQTYILSKLFRKPYTVQIHGLDATYRNPLFRVVVPRAIRRAEVVFCISQAAAGQLKDISVNPDKIHVINLAASDVLYKVSDKTELFSRLELPSGTPTLLTVGRLVERKGVAWFVDQVLPGLVGQYPQLVYLVIGDGPDRAKLEALIERHGLSKNVRLLGQADNDLRLAAYNGADVFVMPNVNVPGDMEGFGLVLLEAALCARPVVAADTEGIKDAVINGKNGLLIPVKDTTGYIKAISGFLANAAYAADFGENARRYTLENYSWERAADRYIELYKTLQTP